MTPIVSAISRQGKLLAPVLRQVGSVHDADCKVYSEHIHSPVLLGQFERGIAFPYLISEVSEHARNIYDALPATRWSSSK